MRVVSAGKVHNPVKRRPLVLNTDGGPSTRELELASDEACSVKVVATVDVNINQHVDLGCTNQKPVNNQTVGGGFQQHTVNASVADGCSPGGWVTITSLHGGRWRGFGEPGHRKTGGDGDQGKTPIRAVSTKRRQVFFFE